MGVESQKIEVEPGTTSNTGGYHEVTSQEVAEMSVKRVRLTFAVLLVIGFVLGIIVKTTVVEFITKWTVDKTCGGDNTCIGSQSVYRISFAMFMFFFIHWALSSSWNLCLAAPARVKFNQQGILIKLLSLIPFFFISFAIPNDFFVVFAWCCVVISVLFLIGQLIILLEFSYSWNEDWTSQEDQKYVTGLLVCTVFMYGVGITFVALSFKWFGSDSSCQTGQAMASVTIVAGLLYSVLALFVPNGSLLPSATVFMYTSYTCFSALQMGPEGPCNAMHTDGIVQLVISTAFSAVTLVYMTLNAATSRSAFQCGEPEQETVEEAEANAFSFFHVQMMMGSCYLCMLLSNWTVVGSTSMASMEPTNYQGPMWAKLSSELVCIVLYVWTLLAPLVCRDRDFS